jgi:hypothetical protein
MDIEKEVICCEAIHLSREDKIHILKMVKRYDASMLKKFPDGTRIRLDSLTEDLVQNIYDYMKHKLNLNASMGTPNSF